MRCPPDAHVASALSLLATLVLAGCRSDSPHAVIYADPASALATGPACVPEAASTSAELPTLLPPSPQEVGVTSMQGGEPDTDVYARPPLHEVSYSTRTSDVGTAYPIPGVDLDASTSSTSSPPAATAAVPPPAARPFPETTFRTPYESTGFPESSFGPQAEP